ncbi:MAG: prepilin-type N-terminal cleavage/methylation domain-containing protein [Candidatus Omnitrophota bacterium]
MNKTDFKANHQGLTLVEGVVTLTILAILSLVAIPRINQMKLNWQLDAAAAEIASHIRYARKLAMETGSPQTISFCNNTNEHSYTIYTGSVANMVADPLEPSKTFYKTLWVPGSPGVGDREFRGLWIAYTFLSTPSGSWSTAAPFNAGGWTYLVFDAQGIPYSADASNPNLRLNAVGYVVINERLENSTPWRIIYIMKETGQVTVER